MSCSVTTSVSTDGRRWCRWRSANTVVPNDEARGDVFDGDDTRPGSVLSLHRYDAIGPLQLPDTKT